MNATYPASKLFLNEFERVGKRVRRQSEIIVAIAPGETSGLTQQDALLIHQKERKAIWATIF